MSLEKRWVEAIHTRLLARYGSRWINLWAGVPTEIVQNDWALQLAGLDAGQIRHALEHLPEGSPPNASEFKAVALRAPRFAPKLVAGPPAKPERVAAYLERMRSAQQARQPLQWAHELEAAEKRGDVLTEAQRRAWRDAIATGPAQTVEQLGEFSPVPSDALPPAMRGGK